MPTTGCRGCDSSGGHNKKAFFNILTQTDKNLGEKKRLSENYCNFARVKSFYNVMY